MMLGRRGYQVMLAEATDALGGRVAKEARLPGLAAWIRVLDYRAAQLERDPNVEIAYNSRLEPDEVLEYGFDHVCIATGSRWRDDGVGRVHTYPIPLSHELPMMTPDDLMAGELPPGEHVVLFDDDHYYMGGVLAELLVKDGRRVTLVTPAPRVSEWADHTMEQKRIQARLMELGVDLLLSHSVEESTAEGVRLACSYTGRPAEVECDALVLVTARLPYDALSAGLAAAGGRVAEAGIRSVVTVGDAFAPGTIATAIWGGRRYAEELDGPPRDGDTVPFLREVVQLA
jgi:dimethylamine/trimethylamine dehydrogenase